MIKENRLTNCQGESLLRAESRVRMRYRLNDGPNLLTFLQSR